METTNPRTSQGTAAYHIFIVSDGTGATAERVVQAALTQFKDASVAIERRP